MVKAKIKLKKLSKKGKEILKKNIIKVKKKKTKDEEMNNFLIKIRKAKRKTLLA